MEMERLHHVTAIVGHPQETYDFYTQVLGLHLIKKTVNFDDISTYHLYFADKYSEEGYTMTFFNWETDRCGRVGSGQVGHTAFKVGKGSLQNWKQQLENNDVEVKETERFNKPTLEFTDRHGLSLALVEDDNQKDAVISGFYGVEILSGRVEATRRHLVDQLGLTEIGESATHFYYEISGADKQVIAVYKSKVDRGFDGVGTVHHVAWQATDRDDLVDWQTTLFETGSQPTEVKDRNYFESIYYREPGFTIFEIATAGPGFQVDEDREALGKELKLPPQYEANREAIEANLTPIEGA